MLKISEIRGKGLENRSLPRFFLLIFCELRKQNKLTKNPKLLTKFLCHVDQAKKRLHKTRLKIPQVDYMLTGFFGDVDQILICFFY